MKDHIHMITGKGVEEDRNLQEASPQDGSMMKEQRLTRRVVLRGALAVGCGLFVPIALFGCESKKGESSTSSTPASSPATSAAPASPASPSSTTAAPASSSNSAASAAPKKLTQASVKYQTQPKGEQKCASCVNFIAESNTCKLVDGQISPDGWCTLWTKKT